MGTQMQQRRGTAAQWAAANPVLADGELGFEEDTKIFKIGDGVTAWNSLMTPFIRSSLFDTAGDLLVGSADDTPAKLARGGTGTVLTVQADGTLAWASARVAKSGDTMTGPLVAPFVQAKDASADDNTILAPTSVEIGSQREAAGVSFIDLHTTVGSDYDTRINATGGVLDVLNAGGLKENGQRVYSPNNPSPTTPIFVYKTAPTIKNNTAAWADDPHLHFPVLANSIYELEAVLFIMGEQATDIAIRFNGPAGSSFSWTGAGPDTTLTSILGNSDGRWVARVNSGPLGTGVSYGTPGSGIELGVVIKCLVGIGSTAGSVAIQWTQNTAGVSDTTVDAFSYMKAIKVY
jgi:hypothetical protein